MLFLVILDYFLFEFKILELNRLIWLLLVQILEHVSDTLVLNILGLYTLKPNRSKLGKIRSEHAHECISLTDYVKN